ncbi:MAG TPA: glycosyltransferase [Pyrinomonadaceae bacterium]|nr:glycosyltransferase [Pyrinomonadaceae bacterium]
MKSVHTLYVCYFGLREPLVQTQVLSYLRQLKSDQLRVSLLTFEPRFRETWSASEIAKQKAALAEEGIAWHCLPYHKSPSLPATLYDIAAGTRKVMSIMSSEGVNVLHARNHVPALMCAIAKRSTGARLVFDIRGFMPEEYTDAGVWPENGYLYRGLKRVERYLLKSSDAFVLLTKKARQIVFPSAVDVDEKGRPIEVIPCCVDFARFETASQRSREALREEFNVSGRRVIVYVGSFGGWYMTDEMTEFLAVAHQQDPSTFSMILTQSPAQAITDRMRQLGIGENDFAVKQVSPGEVPLYLKASDFAISFIKPCYSKQSSSPTKIAEYLASGLPIVCNAGVGDLDELIEGKSTGALLREFSAEAYLNALDKISRMRKEPGLAERLQTIAREEFDLATVGRSRYRHLYERLMDRN